MDNSTKNPQIPGDSLKRIEELMLRHGAVIRRIPEREFMILEKRHLDHFPTKMWPEVKVLYVPKYGREMLFVSRIPPCAGKFIVSYCHDSMSRVEFHGIENVFDSLEDVIAMLEAKSPDEVYSLWDENEPDEENESPAATTAPRP